MESRTSKVGVWTVVLMLALAACNPVGLGPPGEPGEVVTVEGEVRQVDMSEMAVDGPGRIRLRTAEHGRVTILVQSCLGPCVLEAVEALGQMERGERWQATGELQEDGEIVIYEASAHELRPSGDG